MSKDLPLIRLFRNAFSHDPDTGFIYHKDWSGRSFGSDELEREWISTHDGQRAFTSVGPGGYYRATFLGRNYQAHIAIWVLHYGRFPNGQIRHKNGQRKDNRIENLHELSKT